jgi:SAM-dependent methyltransferase
VPHTSGEGRAVIAVIHDFILELARRLNAQAEPSLLDYGCGSGDFVTLANGDGMDAYGVDAFYGGGDARKTLAEKGLLGTRVFGLEDEVIPFPDERFDIVTSNQVFEHIDDFTMPIREIHRVLKPEGFFINLFPAKEVWCEGHIGVPFIHWFPEQSKARLHYATIARSLGVTYHKRAGTGRDWAENNLDWIDKWTYYKPLSQIRETFEARFRIEYFGASYLLYRLEHHPRLKHLAPVFRPRMMAPFLEGLCSRLSGRVFVMRKRDITE